MNFKISPQIPSHFHACYPVIPLFPGTFSETPRTCPQAQQHPELLSRAAVWLFACFSSLLRDSSAVHHMWCLPSASQSHDKGMWVNTTALGKTDNLQRWIFSILFLSIKQSVELEEYALEGSAAWFTIWHVQFLTYFFFSCTWPCGFSALIFQSLLDSRIWGNYHRVAFIACLLPCGCLCFPVVSRKVGSPVKARECKQSSEILTSGSVSVTNTASDSWPVLEFFNGIIIHSCLPRWNLRSKS